MLTGQVSMVKASQDYFSDNSDGYGRKVETAEFKGLTDNDKAELVAMLRGIGYDITPDEKGRW